MKRFGVIGSGTVGKTLAKGLHQHGYEVRMGSRSAGTVSEFAGDASRARTNR